MPVIEAPGPPADAVDVTKEVNELKDKLHQVLSGQDVMIVSMAIGAAIGESFDDEDVLRGILQNLTHMAAVTFAACTFPVISDEEGTIH